MHNIKDIRKNLESFKDRIKKRNVLVDYEKLLSLDKNNREIIQKKENFEKEKKILSKTKNESNFKKSKELTEKISLLEKQSEEIKAHLDKILSNIPNIILDDVPVGKDDLSNKLIKKEGTPKNFNFSILTHDQLGDKNNLIDFKTSIKLSGSRFVVLKGKLALLERALINYMLDLHTQKFNYTEISPPLMVTDKVMYGTGQLPKFEDDQFEILLDSPINRKFLIPTAEVVLTNLVREKIIDNEDLPLRFVASTPCFRKEAGSYGKDTRGMMRQHQFYKVELVSIVNPINCNQELERMLNCAEEVLKNLMIPYKVSLLCSGDMGFSAEKTYDIEAWIPSEKKYREISSCSSCGTFQAKRMNAKFKSSEGINYVGTLNGSGLAVGRLIIALMENYQNSDGTISIPDVLQKYMKNLNKI
tara:strand:+ start:12941 stop:14188 length:1248 start_codon:yes stop_codon:yes gene_type:complete